MAQVECSCGKNLYLISLSSHYKTEYHRRFIAKNPTIKMPHYYKCGCSKKKYQISTLEQHLETNTHKLYFKLGI